MMRCAAVLLVAFLCLCRASMVELQQLHRGELSVSDAVEPRQQLHRRGLSVSDEYVQSQYTPLGRVDPSSTVSFTLTVQPKAGGIEKIDEELQKVSDPRHALYGQLWTVDQVKAEVANPAATLAVEHFFLAMKQSSSLALVNKSKWGERIRISGTALDWERLLETELWQFQHKQDAEFVITRAKDRYILPLELSGHVLHISALDFFTLQRVGRRKMPPPDLHSMKNTKKKKTTGVKEAGRKERLRRRLGNRPPTKRPTPQPTLSTELPAMCYVGVDPSNAEPQLMALPNSSFPAYYCVAFCAPCTSQAATSSGCTEGDVVTVYAGYPAATANTMAQETLVFVNFQACASNGCNAPIPGYCSGGGVGPSAPPSQNMWNPPSPAPVMVLNKDPISYAASNNPIQLISTLYGIASNEASGVPPVGIYGGLDQYAAIQDANLFQSYYGVPQLGSLPSYTWSHEHQQYFREGEAFSQYRLSFHTNDQVCIDNPSTCDEANLDVQYSSSLAQGAGSIYFYDPSGSPTDTTTNLNFLDPLHGIVELDPALNNRPQVVSISYGGPEVSALYFDMKFHLNLTVAEIITCLPTNLTCSPMAQFDAMARQAGLTGITFVNSAGDDGACSATADPSTGAKSCRLGQDGLPIYTPMFPSASAYVLSVGATNGPELNPPVPEVACMGSVFNGLGGGGISTGGGFSVQEPVPAWQTASIAQYFSSLPPSQQPRPGFDAYSNIQNYTMQLPGSGVYVGRGYPDIAALGAMLPVMVGSRISFVSGTSISAPIIAAVIQLVNSARAAAGKGPVGYINPALYQAPTAAFTDIVQGNNMGISSGMYCGVGYNAAPGWDPTTGLGTPIVPALIKYFTMLPGGGVGSLITKAGPYKNPHIPTGMPTMPPIVNVLKFVMQEKATGWITYKTYLGACSSGSEPMATTVWATGVCVEVNEMGVPYMSAIFSAAMGATFSLSVTLYSDLYCAVKKGPPQQLVTSGPDTCFPSPLLLSPQLQIMVGDPTLLNHQIVSFSNSHEMPALNSSGSYIVYGYQTQDACDKGGAVWGQAINLQNATTSLPLQAGAVVWGIPVPRAVNLFVTVDWQCDPTGRFAIGAMYASAVSTANQADGKHVPFSYGVLPTQSCLLQREFYPTNGTKISGMFQTTSCLSSPTSAPVQFSGSDSKGRSDVTVITLSVFGGGLAIALCVGLVWWASASYRRFKAKIALEVEQDLLRRQQWQEQQQRLQSASFKSAQDWQLQQQQWQQQQQQQQQQQTGDAVVNPMTSASASASASVEGAHQPPPLTLAQHPPAAGIELSLLDPSASKRINAASEEERHEGR